MTIRPMTNEERQAAKVRKKKNSLQQQLNCNFCGKPRPKGEKCEFCRSLYEKDYRRNNTSKRRLYNDQKRAQTPDLTEEERQRIAEIYDLCRAVTESSGVLHHVDHIIPVSKGGKHHPDNLQILTAEENLKKSNKHDKGPIMHEQSPTKMTDDEILKLCESLAKRYRRSDIYEDLVSEGLVACYESKEQGKAYRKDYVGAARRAMNDFVNVKNKAVSIPATWASRTVSNSISTGEDLKELEGVDGGTLLSLMQAMRNDVVGYEEDMASVDGAEVDYERVEFENYLIQKIKKSLTEDEWELLQALFVQDMTQSEVGEVYGVSPQAISLKLQEIRRKVSKTVTKSDLSLWRE